MNTVSALASEGMDIELVVPRKWRTFGKSGAVLKQRLVDFYHIEDAFRLRKIWHLPFSPFKLDKVTHGLVAPLVAQLSRPDIIYTRNALPALLALRLGKKVVFEVYRIYDKGSRDAALKLARMTRTSDRIKIITHSLPSRESLLTAGAEPDKVRVIHNGFNPAPVTPQLTRSEARRLIGWPEAEQIVSFAGRIDVNKGANTILALATQLPETTFALIGYSQDDSEDWILREASARGLKNVRKLPWVTTAELGKYLFASDVLLIPPTAGPLMQHGNTVLPIKTFIYMAAGRCILAPALPDIKTVLSDSNAALVPPDDVDAAAETLRRIFSDRAWSDGLAQQARLDSEKYTWRSRAKKIIAFMDDRPC